MNRNLRFSFRVNQYERLLLAALAKHLRRSQSDAIRWLVIGAAHGLDVKVNDELGRKVSNDNWLALPGRGLVRNIYLLSLRIIIA